MIKTKLLNLIILLILTFTLNANANSSNIVRVGFLFGTTERALHNDAKTAVKLWVTSIGRSYGLEADPFFYKNYTTMFKALKNGEIDSLVISSKVYLQHTKDINPYIQDGWISSETNEKFFRYYIVENQSDQHKNKKKLTVSFTNSEVLVKDVIQYYFNKKRTYLETKTNSKALLDLFFNKTDIAIIPERTWETAIEMNPQLSKKLHVIAKTDPIFVNILSFYSTSITPELKEKFIVATHGLDKTKEGKQLSQLFKVKRLIAFEHNDLHALKLFYKNGTNQ